MPPIGWHVSTAREVLTRLGCGDLEDEIGCYLLGSTAPDIRIMTGRPREETHFFDLQQDHEMSGISRLFEAYEHLSGLTGRPKAFVAGYVTHLAVDETWIEQVYRPYFGRGSGLGGSLEADLMDRLLQFHMDQRERMDRDRFKAFYGYVFTADPGEEVGFIDPPTLTRWREVVTRILDQEPTWEAFRTFTMRRFGASGPVDSEQVRTFFESIPEALDRTLSHVTAERVEAFREDAVNRSLAAVKAYMS